MPPHPPEYKIRQRLKLTNELRYRLSSREFGASFDAHYESQYAEFFDKLVAELIGRDAPSMIGKGLRVWIPVWVAYKLGVLPKKPDLIWGILLLYMLVAVAAGFRRSSRKKLDRAQAVLTQNTYAPAALQADAAILAAQTALQGPQDQLPAVLPVLMKDLNDANRTALMTLKVPKWRVDLWRWVE